MTNPIIVLAALKGEVGKGTLAKCIGAAPPELDAEAIHSVHLLSQRESACSR